MAAESQRAKASLRERKKAKTRTAIQHEALRLFRLHGYEATTVEEIADKAEVSPSTFFRYFPSKEDVVLSDDYDPLITEAVRAQPSELSPIRAIRNALFEVFSQLSQDDLEDMFERTQLALSVPELRAAILDQFARTIRQITDLLAEHTGSANDDFALHTLAGAVMGVMISAQFHWVEHPEQNLISLLDNALEQLEFGFQY
ncbi:MAG: TetR family transcriptional regulator [Actinomycetota bacterium]|nr:MAG: TetR family transcriptional regulator [Actinomycetota bacterium]